MNRKYIKEESFDKIDYSRSILEPTEFEGCSFTNCNFQESDMKQVRYMNCTFSECNLSLAKFNNTIIRDCTFINCKMLGLKFENCNPLGLSMSFSYCKLDHSSFFKVSLKKSAHKETSFVACDFSESDLSSVIFENCNLGQAIFDNTLMENTDFRTAYGFSIDPEENKVRKAKFSLNGLPGLLEKYKLEID